MKKYLVYIILIFALVFQNNLYSQYSAQWFSEQLNPTHDVYKSKFINEYTGFVTALKYSENKSKVLITTDRGDNWSTVLSWYPYNTKTTLDAYGSNLWVYHNMQIYHSTNYGQVWSANVFSLSSIVGTAPSEPVVLKFFNQ